MKKKMFDFVIGNPPYQGIATSGIGGFAAPVYDKFMDAAFTVSDKVELIHPARFLFNAGSTPKEWNKKMLSDSHFKIIKYEENAADIFPGQDIKGGIVISYHDKNTDFGAINIFTKYVELNSLLKKTKNKSKDFLSNYAPSTPKFNLDNLINDIPSCKNKIAEKRLSTNVLTKLDNIVFF